MKPGTKRTEDWQVMHPDAAGLDIGAEEIWACVPPGRAEPGVRRFGTFTPELESLVDWLVSCEVNTVALESTGVYWVPVFELLEARGVEVCVVNARAVHNAPTRKSDIQDCQWLQQLHSYGMLRAAFRPEDEIVVLRTYLRQRAMLVHYRAMHIQHMQKALQLMNVQLTQVLSDITGETGLKIIRTILAGERRPERLAALRHGRCQHSEAEIAKALSGHYRPEQVFALQQAVTLYDLYTQQITECDARIAREFANRKPRFDPDDPDQPLGADPKPNSHSKNAPEGDLRAALFGLVGVDLTAVPGIEINSALSLLSEIGTDMRRWTSVKHFCAWLGLAPHARITGGKVISCRTYAGATRAAQILRLAAQSLGRGKSGLSHFYRSIRARLGPQQAVVATAHKLARIIYHMIRDRRPYESSRLEAQDQVRRLRELRALQRRAARLGLVLQPVEVFVSQ